MTDRPRQLVEHFFRHESANLVSALTRVFGFSQLQMVEDTVQSALLAALEHWKHGGVPENPSGWIRRVAKNKALDILRHEQAKAAALARQLDSEIRPRQPAEWVDLLDGELINDSLLRMMFACCHPALDRPSQIALTLKLLCGLTDREIGSALLISEDAAKKRVYRARQQIVQSGIELELPASKQLHRRLDSVHDVLYLLFNEGYSTSTGEVAIREDLCEEAARLCHLLCQDSSLSNGSTKALLALMLFHAARFPSRLDDSGSVVLLEQQDRSQWDRGLILQAQRWLAASAEGPTISTYHCEAGIAMHHCSAMRIADTNWPAIVRLYDRLIELHPNPVYRLNRAVALGEMGQVDRALVELESIVDHPNMKRYFLLDCAFAHLHHLDNNRPLVERHLEQALRLAHSTHEQQLIQVKLQRTRISSGP